MQRIQRMHKCAYRHHCHNAHEDNDCVFLRDAHGFHTDKHHNSGDHIVQNLRRHKRHSEPVHKNLGATVDVAADTYQAQIEATIEDAKNTQNILENSGVVDETNATETTGNGTTEASGTVTGNVQEKENNNSGSVSNIFDWAKDAISGAKDSVANVVENVTISTEDLVQRVENSLNHFIEAVAVMIITSCVIPMLVLLLFFWMVKIVLDVDLSGVKIKGMLPERKE